MQCPECGCSHIRKNGKKRGRQNHICVTCGRQFIDHYDPPLVVQKSRERLVYGESQCETGVTE